MLRLFSAESSFVSLSLADSEEFAAAVEQCLVVPVFAGVTSARRMAGADATCNVTGDTTRNEQGVSQNKSPAPVA